MKIKKLIFVLLMPILAYSQDWANLGKYQAKNTELKMTSNYKERVVFMGNSITEGWLNARPEFFADKRYINRGIGGQTTPQMLLRFRQDVINLSPAVVVILAGINDIAENTGPITLNMIADNITSMVQLAIANNIKVILCSVLPAKDFPWRPGLEPGKKVIQLNELLKACAQKYKIRYLDYYNAMVDDSEGLKADLGYDGVHPNSEGYVIMEKILEPAISEVLKNMK